MTDKITDSKLSEEQLIEVVEKSSQIFPMKIDLKALTLIADAQYQVTSLAAVEAMDYKDASIDTLTENLADAMTKLEQLIKAGDALERSTETGMNSIVKNGWEDAKRFGR